MESLSLAFPMLGTRTVPDIHICRTEAARFRAMAEKETNANVKETLLSLAGQWGELAKAWAVEAATAESRQTVE